MDNLIEYLLDGEVVVQINENDDKNIAFWSVFSSAYNETGIKRSIVDGSRPSKPYFNGR